MFKNILKIFKKKEKIKNLKKKHKIMPIEQNEIRKEKEKTNSNNNIFLKPPLIMSLTTRSEPQPTLTSPVGPPMSLGMSLDPL